MIEASLPVAAAALGLVRSLLVRRFTVNLDAYDAVARKLLDAGDLDRLSKLARAAGASTYPSAIEASLQSVLAVAPDHPESLTRANARDAFVRVHEAAMRRFRLSPLADLVQLGLGPGSVAWLLTHGGEAPAWSIVASAFALLLWFDVTTQRSRLRRADAGRATPIIDLLVEARKRQTTSAYRTPPKREPGGAARYLRVTRGGVQLSSFALDRPIVKIGRAAVSDIVLDDDAVSRMHAVLERSDDELDVIDLGSDQGTLVNGERVSKRALAAGDRLGIGPFEIVIAESPGVAQFAPSPSPSPSTSTDPGRRCDACGGRGFAPLRDAPESVVPAGYRGEYCTRCGKVELFKIIDAS